MLVKTAMTAATQVEPQKKNGILTEMTPSHRVAYSQIPRWVQEHFIEKMVTVHGV